MARDRLLIWVYNAKFFCGLHLPSRTTYPETGIKFKKSRFAEHPNEHVWFLPKNSPFITIWFWDCLVYTFSQKLQRVELHRNYLFQGSFSLNCRSNIWIYLSNADPISLVSDHHWDISSGKQDGNWGRWGPFSGCSTTCDEGTKIRTRTCEYPNPECKGAPCPGCQGEKCSEGIDTDSDRCNYGTEQKCRFSLQTWSWSMILRLIHSWIYIPTFIASLLIL